MAGMRPDQARQFYEEDEDPERVFAIFDAAEKEGRLGRTAPPPRPSDPIPLGQVAGELAQDLRELRLRDRLARLLRRIADALLGSGSNVLGGASRRAGTRR